MTRPRKVVLLRYPETVGTPAEREKRKKKNQRLDTWAETQRVQAKIARAEHEYARREYRRAMDGCAMVDDPGAARLFRLITQAMDLHPGPRRWRLLRALAKHYIADLPPKERPF